MTLNQLERATQRRVIHETFVKRLGYRYAGNLDDQDNKNIREDELRANLLKRGYEEALVTRAIFEFSRAAALPAGASLYDVNLKVYRLLRYGVEVKTDVSSANETVMLINWDAPETNDFAVAEEVSITGNHNKRPDVVLYVNGIALGIIEFKRSTISVGDGIRQNIGNQNAHFIRPFFTTNQLLFAGNDWEGLRYGVIGAGEKYWMKWKEPETSKLGRGVSEILDRALVQMCNKDRLLELIHDFIVFDRGTKKTARHNQYFGVKAAQARIGSREGGIVWHTQGSGKSLTMVWLAQWIREHEDNARVLVITDRDELDKQIEGDFNGVGLGVYRTKSGADLIGQLNATQPWLICSLVHKFHGDDTSDVDDGNDDVSEDFIADLNKRLPADFSVKGNLFVFVDEAHRTQSGKLHDAMKDLMPSAMFIGFTGTPLLKADEESTIAKFGSFIHTYKFDEAVRDGVVLDLRYQARRIDQDLVRPDRVDAWFDANTAGMTDMAKAQLKRRWGTMQKVFSSQPRTNQIVADILMDMARQPRLMDGTGNAMLVCDNVYQACKFYEAFSSTTLKSKLAIVTSYVPNPTLISKEDAGEGDTEEIAKYNIYRQMLSDHFGVPADEAVKRIDEFEEDVKQAFIEKPGEMRLLIVVDKLLTGFDAPSATYLYIDKKMKDHGLFQAICRVNRLDGDDKVYGYIVDYRDLFKSIQAAITDYTSGAFDGYSQEDVKGLLKDRIKEGRQDLDDALDKIRLLCEPVAPPREIADFLQYFCGGDDGDKILLLVNEPKRADLYKAVGALARAYAALANDMAEAGYTAAEAEAIKKEVADFVSLSEGVQLAADENIDLKKYEPAMRQLLDSYIQADPSETIADLEEGLVHTIVELGLGAVNTLPARVRADRRAVAATILNNVRRTIVNKRATDPRYYDEMSRLLDALIAEKRQDSLDYEAFLNQLIDLVKKIGTGEATTPFPKWANTPGKRALVNFCLPYGIDTEGLHDVIESSKEHGWTTSLIKERALELAIADAMPPDTDPGVVTALLALLKENHEYR
ncbi:type I restriction endonuclease subunit R [Geodermatophilus sp. URMC 65]